MDTVPTNDPYAPAQDVKSASTIETVFTYLRVTTSLVGLALILVGVVFTIECFGVVKEIVKTPQQLNAYLDAWIVPPNAEPAQLPAEPEVIAPAPVSSGQPTTPAPVPATAETPAPTDASPVPVAESPAALDAAPQMPNIDTQPTTPPQAVPAPPAQPVKRALIDRGSRQREAAQHESDAVQIMNTISDVITRGGVPRLLGALILISLASLLVRIPFGLIKVGLQIVVAMIAERPQKKNAHQPESETNSLRLPSMREI